MEVNHTRPVEQTNDARSQRTQVAHSQFSSNRNAEGKTEEVRSDAHTRLSREVDRADISKEARELALRDEDEAAREE